MKPIVFKPLLLLFGLILVVSLACLPTTSTGGPTQPPVLPPPVEPPPVQPPVVVGGGPTPTQGSSIEPSAVPPAGGQFFTEEFDGDTSNWSQKIELNAPEGNTSQAKISFEDGKAIFDFGKYLIGYLFYEPYEYANVRIDIRVDNRGTNVNNVLLVCRASDEGHYLINIANSGLFAIYAYDAFNKNYARIADGGSNKIKSGKDINDYAMVCNDKTLILYINGNETRRYTDNKYVLREGKIGVGVASENLIPIRLEFEYVKISAP